MNVRNVFSLIFAAFTSLVVLAGYSTRHQWNGGQVRANPSQTHLADGGAPAPPYPKPSTLTADGGAPAPPYPKPSTLTADGGAPAPPYPKPSTLTADGGAPAPPYPKPSTKVLSLVTLTADGGPQHRIS